MRCGVQYSWIRLLFKLLFSWNLINFQACSGTFRPAVKVRAVGGWQKTARVGGFRHLLENGIRKWDPICAWDGVTGIPPQVRVGQFPRGHFPQLPRRPGPAQRESDGGDQPDWEFDRPEREWPGPIASPGPLGLFQPFPAFGPGPPPEYSGGRAAFTGTDRTTARPITEPPQHSFLTAAPTLGPARPSTLQRPHGETGRRS